MNTCSACTYVGYVHICVSVHVYMCVCVYVCVCSYTYIKLFCCISFPPPNVTVTAPNNQTVGQEITIHCIATTVRGVTSTVNLLWRDERTTLRSINDLNPTTVNNSQVYTDSYRNTQLRTLDEGRVIWCRALINIIRRPIYGMGNTTLNVTGE